MFWKTQRKSQNTPFSPSWFRLVCSDFLRFERLRSLQVGFVKVGRSMFAHRRWVVWGAGQAFPWLLLGRCAMPEATLFFRFVQWCRFRFRQAFASTPETRPAQWDSSSPRGLWAAEPSEIFDIQNGPGRAFFWTKAYCHPWPPSAHGPAFDRIWVGLSSFTPCTLARYMASP